MDIALKVISPAVNDPSTAITCLDQLSRILVRWISRSASDVLLSDPSHVVRVVLPAIDLAGLLDTAFEQIRHYGVADVAISARLLRALDDIAASTEDQGVRTLLTARAQRVYDGCRDRLHEPDLETLRRRLGALRHRRVGGSRELEHRRSNGIARGRVRPGYSRWQRVPDRPALTTGAPACVPVPDRTLRSAAARRR